MIGHSSSTRMVQEPRPGIPKKLKLSAEHFLMEGTRITIRCMSVQSKPSSGIPRVLRGSLVLLVLPWLSNIGSSHRTCILTTSVRMWLLSTTALRSAKRQDPGQLFHQVSRDVRVSIVSGLEELMPTQSLRATSLKRSMSPKPLCSRH